MRIMSCFDIMLRLKILGKVDSESVYTLPCISEQIIMYSVTLFN